MTKLNLRYLLAIILFTFILLLLVYFSANAIVGDMDGGRIWHFSRLFREQGPAQAFTTLEHPVPVILNATLIGMFGVDFPLVLTQGIFSILVVLLVYVFTKKYIDNRAAVFTPLFFLFSPLFFQRSWYLAPYPQILFLTSLSIYFYYGSTQTYNVKKIFLSAFCMSLAVYSHNQALALTFFPLMYFIFQGLLSKNYTFKNVLWFYVALAIITLPWFFWHVSVAGIKYFYATPYTWTFLKYLRRTHKLFWKQPLPFTVEYYVVFYQFLYRNLVSALVLVFASLGLVKVRDKRLFFSWVLVSSLPIIKGIGTYPRYVYTFLPVLIILSCIGYSNALQIISRKAIAFVLLLTCILGFFSISAHLLSFRTEMARTRNRTADIELFKLYVRPNENIFFRSYGLQPAFPHNNLLVKTDISEEDATIFYAWKNDVAVKNVLAKYRIKWIILHNEPERWEKEYHIWLKLATGEYPKHYININRSPFFKKVARSKRYSLYEVLE